MGKTWERAFGGAYAIVANIAEADSALRLGSRVVLQSIPGDPDRVEVRGVSRGGRVVTKYISTKRLRNIRVAWEFQPPPLQFPSKFDAENCIKNRFGTGS